MVFNHHLLTCARAMVREREQAETKLAFAPPPPADPAAAAGGMPAPMPNDPSMMAAGGAVPPADPGAVGGGADLGTMMRQIIQEELGKLQGGQPGAPGAGPAAGGKVKVDPAVILQTAEKCLTACVAIAGAMGITLPPDVLLNPPSQSMLPSQQAGQPVGMAGQPGVTQQAGQSGGIQPIQPMPGVAQPEPAKTGSDGGELGEPYQTRPAVSALLTALNRWTPSN